MFFTLELVFKIKKFILQGLYISSRAEVFCKKGVLGDFAKFTEKKHLCQSLFFNKVAKFCEISKNTFTYLTPPVAVSYFIKDGNECTFNFFVYG